MASVVEGFLRALGWIPPHARTTKGRTCHTSEMHATLAHAIPVADTATVDELLNAIGAHFQRQRNIALSCVQFEEREQQHGQTFDEFSVGLKELDTNADLCAPCLDARLITRIMSGVQSEGLWKKLLALNPFPGLKAVLSICRAEESTENTDADLASIPASVNAASRSRQPQPTGPNGQQHWVGSHTGGQQLQPVQVRRRTAHKARTDCPQTYGTACQSCGKQHHLTEVCEARGQKRQGQSSSFRHHNQSVHSISPWGCPRVNVMIATCTSPHSHILGSSSPFRTLVRTSQSWDGYNSTCWKSPATSSRLLLDRGSLLRTASHSTVSASSISPSTLAPAQLLIGSQSSTRWTEFFWHCTLLEIWEFSPTITPPRYHRTPKPCHAVAGEFLPGTPTQSAEGNSFPSFCVFYLLFFMFLLFFLFFFMSFV